jgi:tetratricopeptide (TPR) repeat protein
MTELEYIENYFSNKLSHDDKQAFEERCESDRTFAEAVSFYILTREQVHEALIDQKKNQFLTQYQELSRNNAGSERRGRTWFYFAAACIFLAIAFLTFFQTASPQQLADAYIDENLTLLSTTMSGETDSLALGIGAFNKKDFKTAEIIFRSLGQNEALAPETTKYLGITYLVNGEYTQAIEQFNKLISFTTLYANPGKFYLALTLMKRGKEGDEAEAKKLLRDVETQKLPGYKEASIWMKDL